MTQMLGQYRNGFHQRMQDEYEDDEYEDYEDEGLEGEEEDEQKQVEERKPSKEELEFLKLREKRKEMYRQKLKKQSAKVFGHSIQSQDSARTLTNAKFGSFFGPSQPVIASRVLDESRSIRETQHIISKPPTSSGNGRVFASASSERKLYEHHQSLKVNEVKRKAQTLKDMRDYSFLLSDDADLPDNKEPQPSSRHVSSAPKPGFSSFGSCLVNSGIIKSKISASGQLKSTSSDHGMTNAVRSSRPMQTKVPMKGAHVSRPLPSSSEPRRIPGGKVGGNGHSRPVVPTPASSKVSVPFKVPVEVMGASKPSSKSMNGLTLKKNISSEKPHSSTQNHYVEQKRASQAADRVKAAPKPAPPSSKSQVPPKPIPSRNIRDEPLKKPVRRRPYEDDDADAIQMIRDMFGYHPNTFVGLDDDDSDMEADFSQIEREERRSSQIARKEDEEQLRLIAEEERRERMRKKRKPSMR